MIDPRLSGYAEQDGKVTGAKMVLMGAQEFISKWNQFQLKAGDPYFKLVHAQFLNQAEAKGDVNIYVTVQDERGGVMPATIWHAWPTNKVGNANWVGAFDCGAGGAGITFVYPTGQGEIAQGPNNFKPSTNTVGPYLVAVFTDPGCGSIASECAYGFGLPFNRHVAYGLTFRICRWGAGEPEPPPGPGPVPPPAGEFDWDRLGRAFQAFGAELRR